MSLKHYIYYIHMICIHRYFERRLFSTYASPPPPIFGASTSQKNRIQDVNASLFGRLIERKLGGEIRALGGGMPTQKNNMFRW